MKILLILSFFISVNLHCGTKTQTVNQVKYKTYLALGDSYTIGESVSQEDSFPYQLASGLNNFGLKTNVPRIIAITGWTSSNLIAGLEKAEITQKFDIVTLLIGVNNQYRQQSLECYRHDFVYLLNQAISHSSKGKSSVFVLSIPDWSATPFGQQYDAMKISKRIDEFNTVNKQVSVCAGVHYINITPSSRLAATDQRLTARDGLHPSSKMYSEWVKNLLPLVKKELDY